MKQIGPSNFIGADSKNIVGLTNYRIIANKSFLRRVQYQAELGIDRKKARFVSIQLLIYSSSSIYFFCSIGIFANVFENNRKAITNP